MLIDQEDDSHVNEHDHDDDDVGLNMLLDQEIDEHDDDGDTKDWVLAGVGYCDIADKIWRHPKSL